MRESESKAILAKVNRKSRVVPVVGTFVSYDDTECLVDIADGRVAAAFGTGYLPGVNEQVLVQFIDDIPYVMGPATPNPHTGTVTAVASGRVTLSTAAGSVGPIPYVGSAPSVGATMRIIWHGGGLALTPAATGTGTAPTNPGGGSVKRHVDTFQAIGSETYNTTYLGNTPGARFNGDVWASDTTLGYWFYGSKIADTIPSDAAPVRCQLYISAKRISGANPVFTVHGSQVPPPGTIALGTAVAVANGQWVDLPAADFINSLKRGGGGFGVATRHGGYNIFKSTSLDGQSGALRITSDY